MPAPTKDRRPLVVRVSPSAFFDIIVGATEAAIVPPSFNERSLKLLTAWDRYRKNKSLRTGPLPPSLIFSDTGLEFTGVLLGTKSEDEFQIAYSVERAFAVTAIRTDDWVAQSDVSPTVVGELAKATGSGWSVIGDVHSHPFMDADPEDITRRRLFFPSTMDWEGRMPGEYEIALVVTVAFARKRKLESPPDQPESLHQIRIGDFEFWLFAHTYKRNRYGQRLTLSVD
jgi:proteasome lid subunit RPN8/RPN11